MVSLFILIPRGFSRPIPSLAHLEPVATMWVEVEQLCSLIQPSIKTTENKLVTILDGAIEIGSSDGTATFETGETFYIKKDSEVSMKADVKTKMINVCYQAP